MSAEPVSTDAVFEAKRVLVTGGTGSLGAHLVDRLLAGVDGRPAQITVLSRDEAKQHDMRLRLARRGRATDEVIYGDAAAQVRFRVGDVRDPRSLRQALEGVDVVVHAAAMKQVPTCEYVPWEAVRTNVEGTVHLVDAVRAAGGVETVVGVSTDKACLPVNVMGMTKALMERVLIEANLTDDATRYVCVRYGNVVASRGSVIPMLVDQVAAGGPLTLTDPAMTRFFLTLDDACATVAAAIAHGLPGEIWVPHVGAARLVDVLDAVRAGTDVDVEVVGIRPGEKLHEQLVSAEEALRTVLVGDYAVIAPLAPEFARRAGTPIGGAWSSEAVDLDADAVAALLARAGVEVGATPR
ncbi:MAG: polysaccharide biosynthesis protein [Acidimicrobiales bacterium]|nr:polysaccharide biosynthesis protein [Acidimicrobiales bacterium]